jgi:putative spermidine/putrescine transport system permease protein
VAPRRRARYRTDGGILLRLWCGAVFAFLLAPIVIIVLTSFTGGETVAFPPSEFSLRWYTKVLAHLADASGVKPGLLSAFLLSLRVGLVVSLGATVAGVLAAYALYRFRVRGLALLRQYFMIPLMLPQIVTGIALLVWFSQLRLISPLGRLILGHMILTLPYVILTTGASLETARPDLEEAAIGLGATRRRAFFLITLPLIREGVVAGAIFALIISFNAFTVSYFLYSGDALPLPVWVFEYMAYFLDPTLAVISTFLIAITLLAIVALDRLVGIRQIARR